MLDETALRLAIVQASRRLVALGLNRGTSGNVGLRCGEQHLLVTPSGLPADELEPSLIVKLDLRSGAVVPPPEPLPQPASGARVIQPSSEWRFHRDILASRPELHAVVHVHSSFATTLACLDLPIPPFHYMVAAAGGRDVRCAPYALFGTEELSRHAVQALHGRKACLLSHHGMIAAGRDLDEAMAVCVEVESLSEMYWRARQIGEPVLLSDAQMDEVIQRFSGYGRNATRADAHSAPIQRP